MEVTAAELLLYCLTIAGLAEFLQTCYQKQMILRKYYALIRITQLKTRRKWVKGLMKPLGVCVYCQIFWINAFCYWFLFSRLDYFVLSVGGTYFALETLRKIKK